MQLSWNVHTLYRSSTRSYPYIMVNLVMGGGDLSNLKK